MNLAGVPLDRPRIVAELSNAHNGSLPNALELIDAVGDAGADFVKFQCYTPNELVNLRGDGPAPDPWGSDGWTMRRLYEKAQTPHAWFPDLVEHCRDAGIPWFSSVFGPTSLALLESLDCPAYKIAALDTDDTGLYANVIGTGKQYVASFRGVPRQDIPDPTWTDTALDWLRSVDVALYCPPGYPQESIDFDVLRVFHGLSYHGTDPKALVAAAAVGATVIECHVQLDDEPSDLEPGVSLTVSQLRDAITQIRGAA